MERGSAMKIVYKYLSFVFVLIIPALVLSSERFTVPVGDSPSLGPEKAPVTIIEFLDYQ